MLEDFNFWLKNTANNLILNKLISIVFLIKIDSPIEISLSGKYRDSKEAH